MNVNNFIFTRTQPKKKLETIEKLSNEELLGVTEATVKKSFKRLAVDVTRVETRNSTLTITDELATTGTRLLRVSIW